MFRCSRKKNELRATLAVNNYQAAYAVTDHIGVMLNGQYKFPSWSSTEDNIEYNYKSKKMLIEGGAGYFMPLEKLGVLEVYGGGGFGKLTFNDSYSDTTGGSSTTYDRYSANTIRFFIQPSIGISSNDLDLAFSTRIVGLKFMNIDTSGYTQTDLIENDISQLNKPLYMFLEPAITLRFGWKYVKFHVQAIASAKLNSEPLNYSPFSVNMGVHIDIAPRYLKKK